MTAGGIRETFVARRMAKASTVFVTPVSLDLVQQS